MYVNFQKNQAGRSVKTVQTNRKLRKFTTCKSNFVKSLLSDMSHLISQSKPNLRSIGSADMLQPRYKVISTDDGRIDKRSDGRTDIANDNIR